MRKCNMPIKRRINSSICIKEKIENEVSVL